MRIEKVTNEGTKACVAGFELDQADKCKWSTTVKKYLTEVPNFEGDDILTIESSMGSIGTMEFTCKTGSDLCKSIKNEMTKIILYGNIGSYPKDGLGVYVDTIHKREVGDDTEVSFFFK